MTIITEIRVGQSVKETRECEGYRGGGYITGWIVEPFDIRKFV